MLAVGKQTYDNIDDAILSLRGAVSAAGSDAADFKALGEVLALDGRADEAIAAYRAALDISEDGAGLVRLAELLMRRNLPCEARASLQKAAAMADMRREWGARLALDYNELADAYFASGDLAAALECHAAAQEIVPSLIDAYVGASLKTHIDHVLDIITPAIVPATHGGPTYHAAAVVWGEIFVGNFLEYCIPSLLAVGNLPFISQYEKILFIVYSTPDSIAAIDAAPQFQELQEYADILFVEIPENLIELTTRQEFPPATRYTNTLQLLSAQHYISTLLARNCAAGVLYVMPDWIYSEDCLRLAHAQLRGGKEIFVAPVLLTGAQGLKQDLNRRAEEGGGLSVPARELAELAVSHLHSSWRQFIARGDKFEARQIPSWMLWPFGDSGLVMHAFHWSVFMVSSKGLGNYRGQRFWTIDHRLLDVLLKGDKDWERVAMCRDTNDFLIIAHDEEDKDYAWAAEQSSVWGIDQIVAAVTPGMAMLSLSQANQVLFREQVVYGPQGDDAACAAAVRRAGKMARTISGRIMDVSVRRV
jgi:hypothetical protein